ncbi:Ran-binding protein 9 [Rhizopus azygosporus]|uniref:Ran-binding protein 9 n=1 Tax=Rhizopus azygosporus TaxID=86630 RepID=A0A367K3K7_RHIAZ|nr:Ran-binding protein 9 [Rhizopus azygosporus]
MDLDCNLLVLDYLVHHCYGKTAKAFIENIKTLDQFAYLPSQTKHCKLNGYSIIDLINASIKDSIGQGEIHRALKVIKDHFPALLEHDELQHISFRLRCQHFIEIIRSGSEMEAILYAQKYLKPVRHEFKEQVREVTSLIAYSDPFQSQSKHLMSQQRRDKLAYEVNCAILDLHCLSDESTIEKIQRQYAVVTDELERIDIKEKKSA